MALISKIMVWYGMVWYVMVCGSLSELKLRLVYISCLLHQQFLRGPIPLIRRTQKRSFESVLSAPKVPYEGKMHHHMIPDRAHSPFRVMQTQNKPLFIVFRTTLLISYFFFGSWMPPTGPEVVYKVSRYK